MAQYLDLDGVRLLWSKIKSATAAGASEVSIDTDAAGAFSGFSMTTIVHNQTGEDGHIEYKLSLTDVQSASALQTMLEGYVTSGTFNTLNGKVTTLIGNDANKSVRTIANEELAAQLIPASALEALDTLQEIAAWIQSHPADAAAFNSRISALETVTALPAAGDEPNEGTIAAYAKGLVTTESNRATGEEARIEQILTKVAGVDGALEDGVLRRLDTLESAIGTPEGGEDISTQVKAVQDAINDLDWTVESGTAAVGFNVLTGFEVENGKLKDNTITTANIDMPTAITTAELNAVLV